MKDRDKAWVVYCVLTVLFIFLALLLLPTAEKKEISYKRASPIECELTACQTDEQCTSSIHCGPDSKCVYGTCYPGATGYTPPSYKNGYTEKTTFCPETYLLNLLILALPFVFIALLVAGFFLKPHKKSKMLKLAVALTVILGIITFIYGLALWAQSTTEKPVIYLYPEETMSVSVEVVPDAWFTKTIPQIANNRWDVIAHPSGELEFGGETYPYLFYESKTYENHNPPQGWVVGAGEVVDWFNEYLPKMGLNEQETADFVEYWSVYLPEADYFRIRLIDPNDYDRSARLTITPAPDTLIRVILVIEMLDEPVGIEAPSLETPKRDGFTAVEWGVILA